MDCSGRLGMGSCFPFPGSTKRWNWCGFHLQGPAAAAASSLGASAHANLELIFYKPLRQWIQSSRALLCWCCTIPESFLPSSFPPPNSLTERSPRNKSDGEGVALISMRCLFAPASFGAYFWFREAQRSGNSGEFTSPAWVWLCRTQVLYLGVDFFHWFFLNDIFQPGWTSSEVLLGGN